jgi:hypothetical protein
MQTSLPAYRFNSARGNDSSHGPDITDHTRPKAYQRVVSRVTKPFKQPSRTESTQHNSITLRVPPATDSGGGYWSERIRKLKGQQPDAANRVFQVRVEEHG